MEQKSFSPLALCGLLVTGFVVAVGTFWAYQRGAGDFSVFHAAWRLALEGRGAEIYRATPDRFLYAPGFAWLLSPLGLLPRDVALAFWCFAKAAAIGYVVREFRSRPSGYWAVPILARPFLIDFQYGQVNTLILGACALGLVGHFRKTGSSFAGDCARWLVLTFAAIAKLFPLPLLLVPWFVTEGIPRLRLRAERMAVVAGALITFVIPAVGLGWRSLIPLHLEWKDALVARGLPLESHNQSFAAFLHHYFTAAPVHVIAEGPVWLVLGHGYLAPGTISLLSLAWVLAMTGILLAWILAGRRKPEPSWIAIAVGLLIVPSHLVWKPYLVMALPLVILALGRLERDWPWLALIFVALNFTGFDFAGHYWAARFEAAALFLWADLLLVGLVRAGMREPREELG